MAMPAASSSSKRTRAPLNIRVHLQRQWLVRSNHLKQVRQLIAKARHNISAHHPHRVASYQLVQVVGEVVNALPSSASRLGWAASMAAKPQLPKGFTVCGNIQKLGDSIRGAPVIVLNRTTESIHQICFHLVCKTRSTLADKS